MSLLDGLKDAMINPMFDAVNEADIDAEFDFETALESVVDKYVELSEKDIAAIFDDNNPDNIVADISSKDESVAKIADDAIDDDLKSLESMLDSFLASEAMVPDDPEPSEDPESTEGCGSKAMEMDDDDTEYDEDDESDEYLSLDSLLKSIF